MPIDQAIIDLIYSISTDAIKILGPAIVASYATYRVTVSQSSFKIKELDTNQEFSARDKIYNYYKERHANAEKSFNELNNIFAEAISKILKKDESGEEFDSLSIKSYIDMYKMHLRFLPNRLEKTLTELEKNNLKETSEYKKLENSKNRAFKNEIDNFEDFKECLYGLIEVYYFLKESNQLLLEKEMKKSFANYLKN